MRGALSVAVSLVLLAGFMRILTAGFVRHYRGRLLNIHPSLLPRHKGLDTHRRALEAGDPEHGCSVHFVTEELDGGPVALQAGVLVDDFTFGIEDGDEIGMSELSAGILLVFHAEEHRQILHGGCFPAQECPVIVEVHPLDAKSHGLSHNGYARITSRHGSCILKVMCSASQQPGSVFAPIHWNDSNASSARVGDLVAPRTDPF